MRPAAVVTIACLVACAGAFAPAPRSAAQRLLLRESAAEEAAAPAPAEAAAPAEPAGPPDAEIPGKMVFDEITLARQATALDALSAKWRRKSELRDWEDSRLTGFSEQAEIINGRSAMFFLVVGLLTEYWTGQSIPEQVVTMARILG